MDSYNSQYFNYQTSPSSSGQCYTSLSYTTTPELAQRHYQTSTPNSVRSYYDYNNSPPQQQQQCYYDNSQFYNYTSDYASQYYQPQQQQYNPVQYTTTQQQSIDSAYCSTNQSASETKPESNRKRKHNDDGDDCDLIVEQIFTEAALMAKQQHQKEVEDCKSNSNCNQSNKRPKILKLADYDASSVECDIMCSYCNLVFNSKAKLIMHEYKYHGNGSSTECPICFKKFGNQANALVHLRAHTQEKTHKCNQCDAAFCDSSTLKKHMRIHTGEKPYECQLCHKKFTQSGNLKRHLNVHKKYPNEAAPLVAESQSYDFNFQQDFFSY